MKKTCIGLCAVAALFSMCDKQTDEITPISLLYGKTYNLKVDKVSNLPDVQFPHDCLRESDYTATADDIQYELTFSADGKSVSIEPGTVVGNRISVSENSVNYELGASLFAGGRLLIWMNPDGYEAEYTIYGSGVPIITSMRGVLE
ncbi:MAG: hypothetical protein R6X09_06605 [Bacteroidales bacterium]